eukprot:359446-Chlamydomonas_euryale.AAC.3
MCPVEPVTRKGVYGRVCVEGCVWKGMRVRGRDGGRPHIQRSRGALGMVRTFWTVQIEFGVGS